MSESNSVRNVFIAEFRALYFLALLAGTTIGLFMPMISVHLEMMGIDAKSVGMNATLYFVFIALGVPLVLRVARYFSMGVIIIFGLVLTAAAASLFPVMHSLPEWHALRGIMGIGASCFMVGAQTLLNSRANESQRALITGMYGLFFAVGFALGPIIGSVSYTISVSGTFLIGALMLLVAIPMVMLNFHGMQPRRYSLNTSALSDNPIPFISIFSYGVAEATLFALYSVFLVHQGYSLSWIGTALGAFVCGGLLGTIPISMIADRYGRQATLFVCVLSGFFLINILLTLSHPVALIIVSLLTGAVVGPIFTVAMAMVGTMTPPEDMLSVNALFILIFSIGAAIGPVLSGTLMDVFSEKHVFTVSLISFVMVFIVFVYDFRRKNREFWRVS